MSTYRSARRDTAVADDYLKTQAPCSFCAKLADVDTLNTYGARCWDCYRDFCAQGRHYPSLGKDDRRAMAGKLSAVLAGGLRPDAGRHLADLSRRTTLTAGQRGFLGAVASHKLPPEGDAPAAVDAAQRPMCTRCGRDGHWLEDCPWPADARATPEDAGPPAWVTEGVPA